MIFDFSRRLERRILYSHIREEEDGIFLLDYLTANFRRHDRAGWSDELKSGSLCVNGKKVVSDCPLKRHDEVEYFPPELPEPEAKLSFKVVYEDEFLMIFDKPANLCVHPTGPFFRHTLWHLVCSQYGELRFLNRLDRETSGLLAAAKDSGTAAMFDGHDYFLRKEYQALVFGDFTSFVHAEGILVPDESSLIPKKKKFLPGVMTGGESADTELIPERRVEPDMTMVRAVLHTGRQHQVRATLYSLGFPLVGDKLYGPDENCYLKLKQRSLTPEDFQRLRRENQALHSSVLELIHPHTKKAIRCESPFVCQLYDGRII